MKPVFIYILLLSTLTMFFLPACKTVRSAEAVSLKSRPSKFILKKLADQRFEAQWLNAKLRISYTDEHQTKNFNANLQMQKDSLIWMNVKKLNVEAARIKITPDSIYVIDRLNKEYFIKGLDFLEKTYILPSRKSGPSNFKVLQEIIFGNAVFFDGTPLNASVNSTNYQLENENDSFDSQYLVDGLYFLLTQMSFKEKRGDQKLSISLEHKASGDEYPNFSYFRNFSFYNKNTGNVSIEAKFSKLELNTPKTFRFEIPAHYKKID